MREDELRSERFRLGYLSRLGRIIAADRDKKSDISNGTATDDADDADDDDETMLELDRWYLNGNGTVAPAQISLQLYEDLDRRTSWHGHTLVIASQGRCERYTATSEMEDDSNSDDTNSTMLNMYTTLADLSMQGSLGKASAMSKATPALLDALPQELEDKVLANLGLQELYRTRAVCKSFRQAIHRHTFRHARRQFLMSSSICSSSSATPSHVHEGSFSPIVLFVNPLGIWEWSGYHLELQKWTKLPTLSCLPAPDRRVLKNFFVAGCDGLLCINIANPLERSVEKLIVCNPLTQSSLELPPLNYRRHPVLLHVLVDHANNRFMILVAGSSSMGSEHLCRKTEVYDSLTSSWEVVADLPGPDFGLNEYQVGVHLNGIIYCIVLTSQTKDEADDDDAAPIQCCKGLLAYSLKDKTWSSNSSYILPRLSSDATFATTQLLECNGSIYVFSEQELYGSHVHFCIAKFDGSDWTVVVNEKRKGYSRGLLVYPEYVCLAHGEGKLCIFNAVEHTMLVYDINSNTKESLTPLPVEHSAGMSKVHTLNPLPFVFRPSFDTAV